MTWLRLDDGFTDNNKIGQLTDRQFRVWLRLLCHCAKNQDPSVNKYVIRSVSGLTFRSVLIFHDLNLLDEIGDEYTIHDWTKYQPTDPTNATRQAKFREKRALRRNAQIPADTDPAAVTETLRLARARSRPVPSLVKEPFVRSNGTGAPDETNERTKNYFDDSHLDADAELDRLKHEADR